MVEYRIVERKEGLKLISNNRLMFGMSIMIFVGDRVQHVTHFSVACDDSEFIGIASYAPKGEDGNGKPEIVGMFVRSDYRGHGISVKLAEEIISAFELTELHFCAVTPSGVAACEAIQRQFPEIEITIQDMSCGFDFM